ncbi:MAG: SDR family oxidoreductase [Desulfobacterales bacterium]|nr:SDR family oxidoreductase [Desulfobacterales bacterium]
MKDRHVLVLGGCGYIGSVLVPALLDAGCRVTVFDIQWFGSHLPPHGQLDVVQGDIRDAAALPMDGVDVVIHLANVANDPCGELNAKLVWEVNVLAAMQVVERALASGVEQFIYASSGSVYGVKEEAQVTEELSLVPISDYNKTKMIAERVLLSYQDQIRLQIVRPATVCGFSPRTRLDVSVNMLTLQALTRGLITVFGGQQTRPNIHIRDIVGVLLHFMGPGRDHIGIFNAGFENISILDMAREITTRVAAEIKVTASNDPRSYRLNSDKLLATGFRPGFGVGTAMDELIGAYGAGILKDRENNYNIKTMKQLMEQGRL